ncbi:MAG TPA: hypothetical protein VG711_08530, partial [Phycisphaerales bacterium]|nr:hypothetical protein [Phycisphaerales bacterium]
MRGMVTACVMMLGVTAGGVNADTVNVRIDPAMQATVGKQVSGRLLLFYITQKGREFDRRLPMDAPNFEHPQPMAGADVREAAVDSVMVIDGKCKAFPSSIDDLDGEVRVQAFLDMDQKERSFEEGVGNLFSDVLTVTVKKGVEDQYELVLSRAIPEMKRRTDNPHVKWVSMKSELLSAFCGHDVSMKAGVALPKHYGEKDWPRKQWPAMYVIPGFGGREESAWTYGEWADSKG